jgi:UDP-GlcNAc:undecaprenyl-phosphate GlcNAc-1-phosphate transferase
MEIPYSYFALIGGYVLAFVVTVSTIPLLRSIAFARGWVDVPDGGRKSHDQPTPTVGGLAIAAGFVISFLYLLLVREVVAVDIAMPPALFWVGALVILVVGFYDDVKGMDFKQKFFFQFVVAYLLLHAGYRIDVDVWFMADLDTYSQALYSIPLTLVWIIGVINAVNLIDGLDGLAGGTVMIAFFSLAAILGMYGHFGLATLSLLMVGALIGFLIFNFEPASIFMGDCGSLFIGFVFAAFTLQQPVHDDPILALVVPAVLLGLPLLDTGLAFIRRLLSGRAIFAPDNDHIHHRLRNRLSEAKTVKCLYAVELVFAAGAVMMTAIATQYVVLVIAALFFSALLGLNALGYLSLPVKDTEWQVQSRRLRSSEGDSLDVNEYSPGLEQDPPVIQESALPESAN